MNDEFRYVVHYCYLRGMNSNQILEEMQGAYGDQAPSRSFVFKWIKLFKEGKNNIDDQLRSGRPIHIKDEDKILEILNREPFSSARDISESSKIHYSTVCFKLNKVMGFKLVSFRYVPHELTAEQKLNRVKMAKDILKTLELGPIIWNRLITGDESWIYWNNSHTKQWIHCGEPRPTTPNHLIADKKSMLTVFFSTRGFLLINLMPQGQKFNSKYMCNTILSNLKTNYEVVRKNAKSKGTYLHMDNAKPHNSQMTKAFIQNLGMNRLPHPAYSPDISPSDFWLFGYLKEKLEGTSHTNENELKQTIVSILQKIPKSDIIKVYENWIERLHAVINSNGEYLQS